MVTEARRPSLLQMPKYNVSLEREQAQRRQLAAERAQRAAAKALREMRERERSAHGDEQQR
jgi:hypothetical protein